MLALWCGCLLLLAIGAHANPTYALISVTGSPLSNASATASLVLATSSIYSTFGNVTTIRVSPAPLLMLIRVGRLTMIFADAVFFCFEERCGSRWHL
jgi:hypothetical protein